MRKTKSINNVALRALLCILLFVLCLVAFIPSVTAQAENVTQSGVLSDLKKDPTFNAVNYPVKDGDYSLNVIQLAEGKNGGLYVYVYQPSWDFKAEEIRMSVTATEDEAKYLDYGLTLVAQEEPFYKYSVNNFKVALADTRYYSIVQITRPWNTVVDGEQKLENGNTVENKVYPVGQTWVAETVNNTVTYSVVELDTITITEKYVGILGYSTHDGLISGSNTEIFYVAFDADVIIERLLEAIIKFDIVVVDVLNGKELSTWKTDQIETVRADDVISINSGTWWTQIKNHKFDAIQKPSDFIESVSYTEDGEKKYRLNETARKEVESMAWVVRFYTGVFTYGWESSGAISKPGSTKMAPSKTSILQLTYETDGTAYNVGVVDDKRTSNGRIDNEVEESFPTWLKWVIAIFGIILGLLIVLPLLFVFAPSVLSLIGKLFVWLINALWWLICLPWSVIAALVRKIKGDGGG